MPHGFRNQVNETLSLPALAFFALGGPALAAVVDTPTAKPNFIIINIDDLGYGDIGPFGSKLNRTPNLDRMAREGRKLTSFYAAPVCSPSRASLMTGCYPQRVWHPAACCSRASPVGLNPKEHTVAELLKEPGLCHRCASASGTSATSRSSCPRGYGFDHYFGLPYSNDMGPAKNANKGEAARTGLPCRWSATTRWCRRVSDADAEPADTRGTPRRRSSSSAPTRSRPFFLYLPHTAVHVPLHPGDEFQRQIEERPLRRLGRGGGLERRPGARHAARPEARPTARWCSSPPTTAARRGPSNAPLRGFKTSTLEGGMREPTIAWWPGQIPAGTASDGITSMMDVLPTFVKLAGGTVPTDHVIDGKDIWPLLAGEAGAKSSAYEAFFYYKGAASRRCAPARGSSTWSAASFTTSTRTSAKRPTSRPRNPDVVQRLRALAAADARRRGRRPSGPRLPAAGPCAGATTLLPVAKN